MRTPTSVAEWAIWIVIAIAIIAVVYVMAQVAGIVIPGWIITLLWICLAAFVVVGVIRFLASLGGPPPP